MVEGSGESSEVTLARLKWEADRRDKEQAETVSELRAVREQLAKMSRSPPRIDVHDGAIHSSCPNCQMESTVSLPPSEPGISSFDDVIGLLDTPHREAGGKKVTECPSCKPKFDAKLKELGYGPLAPVAPAE